MKILPKILVVGLIGSFAVAGSPHGEMADRDIRSMSQSKLSDLRAGKGQGYALVAELNGYPGPRHVLDLAGELALTKNQLKATRELFNRMKAEAIRLGESLIDGERQLEDLFRMRKISETVLFGLTAEIGKTESRLRATHLKYHLSMMKILSAEQVIAYDRLRGYHTSDNKHPLGASHFYSPGEP